MLSHYHNWQGLSQAMLPAASNYFQLSTFDCHEIKVGEHFLQCSLLIVPLMLPFVGSQKASLIILKFISIAEAFRANISAHLFSWNCRAKKGRQKEDA